MAEIIHPWPMDINRRIGIEAARLDRVARSHPNLGEGEAYSDLLDMLHEKEYSQPLMNQEVVVYGTPLTFSMDYDEGIDMIELQPMAVAAQKEYVESRGVYRGLTLKQVYDADQDKVSHRVVHMIWTGSGPAVSDEFGNMHQTHYYEHVLVDGSDIVPYHPVNAHSLIDLSDDKAIDWIDAFLSEDHQSHSHVISGLGSLMNVILEEFEDEADLNHQRVSYINSYNLLNGVVVLTDDFVIGGREVYEKQDPEKGVDFSMPGEGSEVVEIDPYFFQLAHGYHRFDSVVDPILTGGAPELFIEGRLGGGEPAMAPLKSVADIIVTE